MLFSKSTTLHLAFHIRSNKSQGQAMLYGRLRFNGERTTEYRIGVEVPIADWNQKTGSLPAGHPQAETLGLQLTRIRADHERIRLSLQLQRGTAAITASAIRDQWQQENAPAPQKKGRLNAPNPHATLLATYQDYLTHLVTRPEEERKADKTKASYRMAGAHLKAFLLKKKQPGFLAEGVTPGFGMQFYDYLREKEMNADTANRYLNYIKLALHHALLYDRIVVNGLFQFKPPRGSGAKRIVFLSESALAELERLPLTGIRDTVRKWALFMCHTGLDYNDAVAVVKNDAAYRVHTPSGDKWVYQRLKMRHAPAWGECHVPILAPAQMIFNELLTSKHKRPKLKVINTHLKEIAKQLQLPFNLSSKVCRKTAAVVFQREGFSMQSIQKILGHQSLAITEKHYLSIQSFVVDKDMAKVRQSKTTQSSISARPFLSIYKAS